MKVTITYAYNPDFHEAYVARCVALKAYGFSSVSFEAAKEDLLPHLRKRLRVVIPPPEKIEINPDNGQNQ